MGREAQLPGPPRSPRLHLIPPAAVGPHLDALARLAHAAFAPRPWRATPADITRSLDRLTHDTQHPGFILVLAHDSAGHPAGFAYGRPACHLAALAGRPPPHGVAPFELRELAVAPHACGQGLGAALHDTLAAATRAGPRWLVTHPHAAPALALYRARGWQTARLLSIPSGQARVLMHRSR